MGFSFGGSVSLEVHGTMTTGAEARDLLWDLTRPCKGRSSTVWWRPWCGVLRAFAAVKPIISCAI